MEAEAGAEGDAGKMAVANVVRNRADSNYGGYGKDITSQVRAPLQFSAFNRHGAVNATGKRTMAMDPNSDVMRHNYELADRVLARMTPDNTGGANQYYAPQGMPGHRAPKWWNDKYQTATVGHQRFQQNPNTPVTPDNGRAMPGDQQMLASMGGGKTQDAGTSPMATMLAQAVAPKPQAQTAQAASPLPPEAASNQRYAAMNSVAPRGGNDTSFRDMARHTAYAPNRMEALGDVKPMSSAEYLVANSGGAGVSPRDPGVSAPPPASPMADTPVLQEPLSAGTPGGGEGMAMNSIAPEMGQPSGLANMMMGAAMPPEMMGGQGFEMGGGFGGGFGDFNLGSLFG